MKLEKLPDQIPADFGFPDSSQFGYGGIGPNGEMQTPTVFIEAKKLETIEPRQEWYFWGWIEYDDIFEGTFRHRTEFCFNIERIRFPETGEVAMGLRPYPRFNAMDGDCLRSFDHHHNRYG